MLKTRAGTKGKGLFENFNLIEVLMVGRLENGLIEVGLMPTLAEKYSKLGTKKPFCQECGWEIDVSSLDLYIRAGDMYK